MSTSVPPADAAVVFTASGDPDVLHVVRLPSPAPGPSEVRVRVSGAAVHPTDLFLRAGLRPLAGDGPHIPGMAFAGVVDAVGPGSRWRPGARVMGMALPSSPYGGAYRGSLIAPDDTIAAVADDVDLFAAATLPMNGHTALQALRKTGVAAGDTLAVTGAAGALGTLTASLAAEHGVRVVAVARADDRDHAIARGATWFVAGGDGDEAAKIVAAVGAPVDAAIDAAVLDARLLGAIRPGGVLATLRGWVPDTDTAVRVAPIRVPEEWHAGSSLTPLAHPRHLTRPVRLLRPSDAPQAHRMVERGGLRENVVLDFS